MVETAEETTKNQAHKAMVAPQARCTWKVKRAENAGPAGKVVDQALEASEIAVASFTETLTPPATMSCCITPLIATSDARDAMMTITTAKALARSEERRGGNDGRGRQPRAPKQDIIAIEMADRQS